MTEDFNFDSRRSKGGCKGWQVAILCSVLVAIGLAVGLGVGLTNQTTVYVTVTDPPPSTSKSDVITATSGSDAATTTAQPTTSSIPADGPWKNYRLPTYITPTHYRLTLHPNATTDTYTGTNAMSIVVSMSTKYVLVHVDQLVDVTSTKLEQVGSDGSLTDVEIVNEFRYEEFEFYVVETKDPLDGNNQEYLLTFGFESSLILRIVGLYKSVYTDPISGQEKAVVGSDMEPTDARKAYPCFDEPAMKINFTTTLIHELNLTALSNMPIAEQTVRDDGLMETRFETSPKMSCYLGCFAISEFVYEEAFSEKNNISLRVYIPPHQKAAGQARYALGVMKIVFDYFEVLFDMDYALPKCDMIAIPNFGTGAMENWGLITYRETNLLWDRRESSTSNKQRVAQVVAHELVHQWYGNVVTMDWWDNIWLNEGFASYLEYFGEQAAEPDWQMFDQFVIDDLQPTMLSDDSVTSRSIVSPVTTPSEITSTFDSISYSKGASVLRYMHTLLGDDAFFGGLQHYLKKRAFSNANETQLFGDIQEYVDASTSLNIDVSAMMLPWVQQMGFPVVTLTSSGDVSQDHFLIDPNADRDTRPSSPYDYKWPIELTFITSDNDTVISKMMEIGDASVMLDIGSLGADSWVKVNPGETGFYRVNYDDITWETISGQLISNRSVFSEIDRSNLVDDAFNLAPAELITYPQALNMTRYLDQEESFFVWDAFSRGSSYIQSMLSATSYYSDFTRYYRGKVKPIAVSLGWNTSVGTHIQKLQRSLVLGRALSYGDTDAINNATSLFRQWIDDKTYYLEPDTRQLVYRYGVPSASVEEWEEMLNRYVIEPIASEKTNLLRGLTSTQNVDLIDRMLEYSKNASIIKSQDFFTCITYISYTVNGNRMAWAWVQLNWEYMVDRFGITDRSFGRLVPNIVSGYNTEVQLWEVESFFAKYPEAGAGASGRISAVNSIKTNINWLEKNKDVIGVWLGEQLTT